MPERDQESLTIAAVVPLYNGAAFIEAALMSIVTQIRAADEIIVVDDGSTDDGPAIVTRLAAVYPIRLVARGNGGQSSARNLGVRLSNGSHIAFLDQDDLWYPFHLEELERTILHSEAGRLGWVYSNLDEIDEAGAVVLRRKLDRLPSRHPKTSVQDCLRDDMFVLPSASLIVRAAFDAVGGFDERLCGYEDDDLFLRMFRAGYTHVYLDKPLSQWRIHAGSTSFSPIMARSRLIYADKLFAAFPDEASPGRWFSRNLIAPRFVRLLLDEYARALRADNWLDLRTTAATLRHVIVPRLHRNQRVFFLIASFAMQSALLGRVGLRLGRLFGGLGAFRRMARAR
ncbi:glycosyltransferase family 2 protein [Lichenifustis flavocetrariae]|uniref:Glycosyltransferase n=1 Tax=Lichenifustis flavocetrariae TaxID=2949735 RepID=A0AA41YVY8_9HYPH|nr:glycosyltransferase [Lichenifustis flavocetrariae]MCW6509614.1 glycosyltransferase [Lichenifustis flavocetrariae]